VNLPEASETHRWFLARGHDFDSEYVIEDKISSEIDTPGNIDYHGDTM
jgi:hypothetical protein